MKKSTKWSIAVLAALFVFLSASPVYAHVTVRPFESQTGAYEKYTIRVPVEKESNTTELTLKVPKGVSLVSVMPMDGWEYKMSKDADGNVSSVDWKATDKGIGPNEFEEFSFIGANPNEPVKVSWKAIQKYDDNSVVKWEGAPDADEPASVTDIVKAEGTDHHGAHGAAPQKDMKEKSDRISAIDWIALALSIIALIIAVVGISMKRRTK